MRRVFAGLLGAAALGCAVSPGFAETDLKLAACMESNAYLDREQTIEACMPALGQKNLEDKEKAAVNSQLGEAFYFLFDPGEAVVYLNQAISLNPSDPQAYRRRGWAQLQLQNFSKAVDDFTQFIALAPDDPDAQFAMAYLRSESGISCAESAADFEHILKNHPDHYITRMNLAGVYKCADNDNPTRAIAEYERILGAGRNAIADTKYYSRMGRKGTDFYAFVTSLDAEALRMAGRYGEAQRAFSWVVETYPEDVPAHSGRALVRNQLHDAQGALEDADFVLARRPQHPDAQSAKVEALAQLHRDDDTIAFANGVLASGVRSMTTSDFNFWRGVAYHRKGDAKSAFADFKVAAAEGRWVWQLHTQIVQSGYLSGPVAERHFDDGGPPVDGRSKEFVNALEACSIDPECIK